MIRCPQCRTRRASYASMMAHVKASGHKLCDCGGYHFPQQPYSAVQILEEAVKQSTPGKIVKSFGNGEVFQSNSKIRGKKELQCL